MGGAQNLRSFYRLFMAPGMEHCGGGPGPNAIGGVFAPPSPSRDPAHAVVATLAHWFENGAAPDFIVATRYLGQGARRAAPLVSVSGPQRVPSAQGDRGEDRRHDRRRRR